ncbi:hypothetical protein BS47DRAFT_1364518 [Hydnum rufescens UP504]|uniref:Uncharacterized protein n=1 Tax=Hydnum rufescens UP504 TaxID=1448309 RepID=A0A9P6AR73_9AGAM|nr:hypothetical protein BS47DRAFT_1364518 [Hydnum rufescens UP504]
MRPTSGHMNHTPTAADPKPPETTRSQRVAPGTTHPLRQVCGTMQDTHANRTSAVVDVRLYVSTTHKVKIHQMRMNEMDTHQMNPPLKHPPKHRRDDEGPPTKSRQCDTNPHEPHTLVCGGFLWHSSEPTMNHQAKARPMNTMTLPNEHHDPTKRTP